MRVPQLRETVRAGWGRDEGQVSIMVILAVCFFILLFMGFGVDMTNLFFHRQMAQSAADSACVAGAMDMLVSQQGTAAGNFVVGAAFNCNSSAPAAPCQYAKLNGYSSPSASIPAAGTESNFVSVSFPSSIPGVVAPAAAIAGPYPFMQVDVYDGVKVYFSSLLNGTSTQNVHALAKCGLQLAQAPVPILVLDPTEQPTFDTGGTPTVVIVGGPSRAIQVNSNNPTAVNIFGSANVNLSGGGPAFNGSNLGVFGGPNTAPGTNNWTPGNGQWVSPAAPIPDPFKAVKPPADPGVVGTKTHVAYGTNGCPDSTNGCDEYTGGRYVGGILVQNSTALFDPGVYYLEGGQLSFHANSTVRPSTAAGDGSMGTIFYLTCTTPGACAAGSLATVDITANSGTKAGDPFASSRALCPGNSSFPVQLGIPATLGGNVLLAPCTQDGTYPFAPQTGRTGPDRGILFFQDRSTSAATTFNGGAGLLLVGTMYFHDCPNTLTTGCNPPPTDWQSSLTMAGGSGAGTRLVGEIVTDNLHMRGISTITMDINPFPLIDILKVALLQ